LLEQWAGEISEGEKAMAGELAKRLGYLPLALVLAGAQAQGGETWSNLLAVFRDAQKADITLLDLDDPNMRDESLRLAFDLSLRRLESALPEKFAMLGVFAAGREAPFSAEATASVWQVDSRQAAKILGRLVRAALLNKEGKLYSLHLLLGDYALSQLSESARQIAEERHQSFYFGVARQSELGWQIAEAALPQMRTAWSRVSDNDASSLFTWIQAVSKFFDRRGLWVDKLAWLRRTLIAVKAATERQHEGWCERELGVVFHNLGELTEATDRYRTSLTIAREVKDKFGEASTLDHLGHIHHLLGRLDEARAYYEHSLALRRETGDRKGEATTLRNIGRVRETLAEYDAALKYYQASLSIQKEIGDRGEEAAALSSIGGIHLRRGEWREAFQHLESSLAIRREIGDRRGEAVALGQIGQINDRLSELAELQELLEGANEAEHQHSEAIPASETEAPHEKIEELNIALEHYQNSLSLRRAVGDQIGEAAMLNKIGDLYERCGKLNEALDLYRSSLAIQRDTGDRIGEAVTLLSIGIVHKKLGRATEAEEMLTEALVLYETMGLPEAESVRQLLWTFRGLTVLDTM
jgi:tetratricopeptide (TPR) repeat protein